MQHDDDCFDPDYRRCPRHPQVRTSDASGMFDGLCNLCESEMEQEQYDDFDPAQFGDVSDVPVPASLLPRCLECKGTTIPIEHGNVRCVHCGLEFSSEYGR
jgi:hypothetical protein